MGTIILVAFIIVAVGSTIAQKALLTSIYQKTGKNLSGISFWSVLGVAGVLIAATSFASELGALGLAGLFLCVPLCIRNCKIAGGVGIALAFAQILSFAVTAILFIVSLVFRAAGAQINLANFTQVKLDEQKLKQDAANKQWADKQRAEQAEQQEAYAQKKYGMTAQEAWDAGYKEIDPDLLKK